MWQWTITDFEAGQPLLAALGLRIPAVPAGLLRQLLRTGRISCNGATIHNEGPVPAGMTVAIRTSARLDELIAAGGLLPEALLFEDRHGLVVAKPAGLAVHGAAGVEEHLQERVARFLAWRQIPYQARPVHRLDIGTSGPVLFGKGRQATGDYGRLLMAGRFTKRYLALVTGNVPGSGDLTTPVPDGGRLKDAVSRYRRLATAGRYTLLDLELVTGRPHQARRQLADAGWPIVNDRRYGGRLLEGARYPWLHCRQLGFPDLDSDRRHQVDVPIPAALSDILGRLGFDQFALMAFAGGNFLTTVPQERL
jgi:23S rRNA pseudouridine955/2504/2580 synthase